MSTTVPRRWRASIYKLVWLDLLCFLILYYILNFTYRWMLDEDGKRVFESIVSYCLKYSELIPLSFVLGFYVSIVMTRWWNQYITIPWPDSVAVFVSAHVHGQDERGRLMRRTMMRYVCLCITMVLTMISPKVKKRFPTLDHLIEAGLLLENEKQIMVDLNEKFPKHSKHWLPIVWSASIVTRARKEGRVRDDFAVKTVIDELNKFRGQCGLLLSYDTISIPLVYTQVVTLAVYSYFGTAVMARQWTQEQVVQDSTSFLIRQINNIDIYFPIFTCLQFFFYMGWLKVAESLINPFGEDDDDFEVSWMVDRNIQVSYMIVDEMHHEHPELIRDQYWDEVFPVELPYTVASEGQRESVPLPSTAKIDVPMNQQILTMSPSSVKIDDLVREKSVSYKFPPAENTNDDNVSGIHFSAGGHRSIRRKPSDLSSASLSSTAQPQGSMQRTNSVTSVIRRIFSREDTTRANEVDGGNQNKDISSATSIPGRHPGAGSIRIADQVIEELDEQNTITSNATKNEQRPTAASLFGPPPPSAPVNVPLNNFSRAFSQEPNVNHGHQNKTNHGLLSSSAPVAWGETVGGLLAPSAYPSPPRSRGSSVNSRSRHRLDSDIGPVLSAAGSHVMENESEVTTGYRSNRSTRRIHPAPSAHEDETASVISSDETGEEDDDFHKLKATREKERMARYMQKLIARSVSAQQTMGAESYPDNEILLAELTKESKRHPLSKEHSQHSMDDPDSGPSPKNT